MRIKLFIIVFVCAISLIIGCMAPTDVDASRNRIVENENKELNKNIFAEPQEINFYFVEPVGSETKYFRIINNNTSRYTLSNIILKHSTRYLSKSHHVLPVTLESRFYQLLNFENVYITFEPKEPGEYYDEIYVNDMDYPILIVKGIVQTLRMPGVDFGEVPLENSKRINVTFTNYSKNSIFLKSSDLVDLYGVFSYEMLNYPVEVKSKQQFSFWVKFEPNSKRMFTGSITFSIQADGYVDNTCELSGKGK